ncbi:MAG: hypothetical protein LKK26_08375 [Solobacterium sp.]|nr:hypothetical protein [Solobacterium sp.]
MRERLKKNLRMLSGYSRHQQFRNRGTEHEHDKQSEKPCPADPQIFPAVDHQQKKNTEKTCAYIRSDKKMILIKHRENSLLYPFATPDNDITCPIIIGGMFPCMQGKEKGHIWIVDMLMPAIVFKTVQQSQAARSACRRQRNKKDCSSIPAVAAQLQSAFYFSDNSKRSR